MNKWLSIASRLPMRNWNYTMKGGETVKIIKLPDYLWGIETWISGKFRSEVFGLPDYLWGIETPSKVTVCTLGSASRLPMRNWNGEAINMGQGSYGKLPDYLWGIETFLREVLLFGFLLLPDYLWGIETLDVCLCGVDILRFQTTYEELKLVSLSTIHGYPGCFQTTYEELKLPTSSELRPAIIFCFQTTYEELKLLWFWYQGMYIMSFQTTYEELKRVAVNCTEAGLFAASRLPMRNWNSPESFVLWGCGLNSFQTTYEELKLRKHRCKRRNILWASRLPMRNWNEDGSIRPPPPRQRLPDYLWGIETRHRIDWRHCPACFQTTYEELKLNYESAWRKPFGEASRLPMRNWNFTR